MDELKLNAWKQRFEAEVNRLSRESEFFRQGADKLYSIGLDESDEWRLQVSRDVPDAIRKQLQEIFLRVKPEDSI